MAAVCTPTALSLGNTSTWAWFQPHIHLLLFVVTGPEEVLFSLVSEVGPVETVFVSLGKPSEFVQGIHLERQQLGPLAADWPIDLDWGTRSL